MFFELCLMLNQNVLIGHIRIFGIELGRACIGGSCGGIY